MDRFSFIGHTRSIGLIGAMEFSADPASRKKFASHHKIAAQAVAKIQENGVILRALPGDIIGFCPPLVISDAELDDMFARVETALAGFETTASALR
jgi:4-aminobutyrate--pyruvate transaminase